MDVGLARRLLVVSWKIVGSEAVDSMVVGSETVLGVGWLGSCWIWWSLAGILSSWRRSTQWWLSWRWLRTLLTWLRSYAVAMAWIVQCWHSLDRKMLAWLRSYAVGMASIVQCWHGLAHMQLAWLGSHGVGMAWMVRSARL